MARSRVCYGRGVPTFRERVLVVDDEEFVRTIVADSLSKSGMEVESSNSVAGALVLLDSFDPHVVISDLDFGGGPDGADLLNKIHTERPWTGMVVLTSHASAQLGIASGNRLPEGCVYLVKSDLGSTDDLIQAIKDSIAKEDIEALPRAEADGRFQVSALQGEILKMLAEGLSNSGIARRRGASVRATETLIQRTFSALGIESNPDINPRVIAVRLWQQGKVSIK